MAVNNQQALDAALMAGASIEDINALRGRAGLTQFQQAPTLQVSSAGFVEDPNKQVGLLQDFKNARTKPINMYGDVGLLSSRPDVGLIGRMKKAQEMGNEALLRDAMPTETPTPDFRTRRDIRDEQPSDITAGSPTTRVPLSGFRERAAADAAEAHERVKDPSQPTTPEDLVTVSNAMKEDAKAKGTPESELTPTKPKNVEQGAWDKLSDAFDLTTVGLSLLATSGNGKGLAANMGVALQAGMQSNLSKVEDTREQAEVARKADLEERKVKVQELQQKALENYYIISGTAKGSEASNKALKDQLDITKKKIDIATGALGLKEAKAKPSLTTSTASQQHLFGLEGVDSLKDISKEEAPTFKSFTQAHGNYSQFVINSAKKLGVPELATNTSLRNIVVDNILASNNPEYKELFKGAGTSGNTELSAKAQALYGTEAYQTLLAALGSGSL